VAATRPGCVSSTRMPVTIGHLGHQDGVLGQREGTVQDHGDGYRPGHPVGDGVDQVGGDAGRVGPVRPHAPAATSVESRLASRRMTCGRAR